ncbi:unnamed protein product [Paramecium sonneborni]|uniref:Uncharacterized protein n=1 Tax=Paramecium sonneborni TaxID=65129 RepID=A0A8S1RRV3_9CILI|nr:unnamed protein product [Paramecium sonneborni]
MIFNSYKSSQNRQNLFPTAQQVQQATITNNQKSVSFISQVHTLNKNHHKHDLPKL